MTAADTNVRPVWRGPATTARRAGGSLLARLLLYFWKHFFKLDRKPLLLLLAASLTPSCIIPVGPDFQDPPGVANSPPHFVVAAPEPGSTTANPTATFSATFGDNNVADVLHVLWISEFPPGDATIKIDEGTIDPLNGSIIRTPTTATPDCTSLARGVSSHSIQVGVSDHEFVKPIDPRNPFATKDNVPAQRVNWTLVRSCPL